MTAFISYIHGFKSSELDMQINEIPCLSDDSLGVIQDKKCVALLYLKIMWKVS